MKIIVEGDAAKRQPVRFSCKYCGCVFDADKSEYDIAEESIEAHYNGMQYKLVTLYSCDCPCCGRVVIARLEQEY